MGFIQLIFSRIRVTCYRIGQRWHVEITSGTADVQGAKK